tara:strand:+ start:847 stop:1251 length:405 start_codon:yes stop_codon:yes gene_type:complete
MSNNIIKIFLLFIPIIYAVDIITITYTSDQKLLPFFSNNDKVLFIFSNFDISPKDDYLGYSELKLFQSLTDPQLPLDVATYKWIINLLGGNFMNGITLDVFNSSYYKYKEVLGTDLDKDFKIIYNLINNHRNVY